MQFEFTKWQGIGNDFVIVNGFKYDVDRYSKLAEAVCDRRFGIGADGLVFISPSAQCDFSMRIFNADGSEAEMCGNVTRCVARYVYEEGLTDKKAISLETKAGVIRPELIFKEGKIAAVKVNMGQPILAGEEVPVSGFGMDKIIAKPLMVGKAQYEITCVSMGNPHCVIFVDDITQVDLGKIGPQLETHAIFPKKINVEFAEVKDRSHIRMRVWERGSGITMACGTGACATLTAAVLNGKTARLAELELDGGNLTIEWNETDGCVYMTGPAQRVFSGNYETYA